MKRNNLMKKVSEILENIYNEQRIDDRIMASSSAADEFNVVDKIRGLHQMVKKKQKKIHITWILLKTYLLERK